MLSYIRRSSFDVKKLNVDDEFASQRNLNCPYEILTAFELLINNIYK